jgi:hypothetical protein
VEPNAKRPPKEPEERKHQFATWYIFAAFLGVILIQFLSPAPGRAIGRRLRLGKPHTSAPTRI